MNCLIVFGIPNQKTIKEIVEQFSQVIIVDANNAKIVKLKKEISHLNHVVLINQAVAGKDTMLYSLLKKNNKKIYRHKIDYEYLLQEDHYIFNSERLIATNVISLIMTLIDSQIYDIKDTRLSVLTVIKYFNTEIVAALLDSCFYINSFLIESSDTNCLRILQSSIYKNISRLENIPFICCQPDGPEAVQQKLFNKQVYRRMDNLRSAIEGANTAFDVNRVLVKYSPLINLLGLVENTKREKASNSKVSILNSKITKLTVENNYLRSKFK